MNIAVHLPIVFFFFSSYWLDKKEKHFENSKLPQKKTSVYRYLTSVTSVNCRSAIQGVLATSESGRKKRITVT